MTCGKSSYVTRTNDVLKAFTALTSANVSDVMRREIVILYVCNCAMQCYGSVNGFRLVCRAVVSVFIVIPRGTGMTRPLQMRSQLYIVFYYKI